MQRCVTDHAKSQARAWLPQQAPTVVHVTSSLCSACPACLTLVVACLLLPTDLSGADDLRLVYLTGSDMETLRTPLPGGSNATTKVDSSSNFELQFVGLGSQPGLRTPFTLGIGYSELDVSAGGIDTSLTACYLRAGLGIGYWHEFIGIEVSAFGGGGLSEIEQSGNGFRASDDPWYYEYGAQAWLTAGFEPGFVGGIGASWFNAPIEADLGHTSDDFTRNGFNIGAFIAYRIN